jgi:hypothetical protein
VKAVDPDLSLQSELSRGERLLWYGRPRGGIRFRPADAFMAPFSLLWGGFAIAWETLVVGSGAPFPFSLWGMPFVLIGLYMIGGRFVVDKLRRERTVYGLTDERIIIRAGLFNRVLKSLSLETMSDLTLDEKPDRSGTITFGPQLPFSRWYGSREWGGPPLMPAFELIDNARDVFDRIRAAQHEARRDSDPPEKEL